MTGTQTLEKQLETNYCILRLLQTDISPINVKNPLNYLPKSRSTCKHGRSEKKKGEHMRGGHVTGSFAGG